MRLVNLAVRPALSIRQTLLGVVLLSVGGLVVFGLLAALAIDRARVNGPHYQRIADGKDLVADVMPPPAYLVESYLVVHQMLAETDRAIRDLRFRGVEIFTDINGKPVDAPELMPL